MYHRFIYSLKNYEKDLYIITNISGKHFNISYDKKYNYFLNNNKILFFLYFPVYYINSKDKLKKIRIVILL